MKYIYFASFVSESLFDGTQIFGNCRYESSEKIEDFGHINKIKADLENTFSAKNVIVINYQLMRIEEEDK